MMIYNILNMVMFFLVLVSLLVISIIFKMQNNEQDRKIESGKQGFVENTYYDDRENDYIKSVLSADAKLIAREHDHITGETKLISVLNKSETCIPLNEPFLYINDWTPERYFRFIYLFTDFLVSSYAVDPSITDYKVLIDNINDWIKSHSEGDTALLCFLHKYGSSLEKEYDDGFYLRHKVIYASEEFRVIKVKYALYREIEFNMIPCAFEMECLLKYTSSNYIQYGTLFTNSGDVVDFALDKENKRLECYALNIWGGLIGTIGVYDTQMVLPYINDNYYTFGRVLGSKRVNKKTKFIIRVAAYKKSDLDNYAISFDSDSYRQNHLEQQIIQKQSNAVKNRNIEEEKNICEIIINSIEDSRDPNAAFLVNSTRSDEITTLSYREMELLRVKWSEKNKWIAIQMPSEVIREKYYDDDRFDYQRNKKAPMWKSRVESMEDILDRLPIILEVFDYIENEKLIGVFTNGVFTEEEKKYINAAITVLTEVTHDSSNIFVRRVDRVIRITYYSWPMDIEFNVSPTTTNRFYCFDDEVPGIKVKKKKNYTIGYIEFDDPSFFERVKPVLEKRYAKLYLPKNKKGG